jgi:hypothetical protein
MKNLSITFMEAVTRTPSPRYANRGTFGEVLLMPKLRRIMLTATLAGTMLLTMALPAHAEWYYSWSGSYPSWETCDAAATAQVEQEAGYGQGFMIVTPCANYPGDPMRLRGLGAGWYYEYAIFAA